jgi:small subunit ribosomal protein S16
VAVKIRLKRMGKIRAPYYRVVVMDSRAKRDGRAIEEIGKYHPTEEPSLIDIKSERAQYWLGVGAQPSEQVLALLKVTGDWQKFKGLPGAEGTLRTKDTTPASAEAKAAAVKAAEDEAEKRKARAAEAKSAETAQEAGSDAATGDDETNAG